ncbi:MAG: response regulator [Spirochaetes bacterium]|nr:MAG: response regulator [Spirochaetota bacterium]
MGMKSILVINDSSLLRSFLEKQLKEYGFEVLQAINGLDGWGKIRQLQPDLIIMDYFLTRKSSMEILKSMKDDPNIGSIPVVMTISKLEKKQVMELAQMGVQKILNKPVRIDALLETLTELLHVAIEMDETPCILDAHLNDQILFVEIARGFNREKINLLRYKIAELIKLYSVSDPRILILMTDIEFRSEDESKLEILLEEIIGSVRKPDRIRILTVSGEIKAYLTKHIILSEIEVAKSLEEAMDGLLGIKGMESLTAEQDNVQDKFFSAKQDVQKEDFQLNFQKEVPEESLNQFGGKVRIAVVDDDMIVREIIRNAFSATGWEIVPFVNGVEFVEKLETDRAFDLLFLDLIMPEMNGFAVLQMMNGKKIEIPTIILTALSRKESVVKAQEFGVSSYMIKPIRPEGILAKAAEILGAGF